MKNLKNLSLVYKLYLIAICLISTFSFFACERENGIKPDEPTSLSNLRDSETVMGYATDAEEYILTVNYDELKNYIEDRINSDTAFANGPYSVQELKIAKLGEEYILYSFLLNSTEENSIALAAQLTRNSNNQFIMDAIPPVHTCTGLPCNRCKITHDSNNTWGCDCVGWGLFCNHRASSGFFDSYY